MQINQYANETHDWLRTERLVLLSWAIQTQKSHTTYTALDLKFRKRPQQKFKKKKKKKKPPILCKIYRSVPLIPISPILTDDVKTIFFN